ncbi:MAG TPA: hypothetical protein VK395_23850 [Gemmataceae bacterium]|nr:hypothetical protein [Gemmataceae bacterium]
MNKLIWAALLGLPALALYPQQAAADGCLNLQGGFRLKICASGFFKAWCEPCGCAPACAPGCGGSGGFNECSGVVPGPWYLYWPYGGSGYMTAPSTYPGWVYDNNFQTPAPVYPYWPQSSAPAAAAPGYQAPSQFLNTSTQPAGYYPSYWYGR